MPKPNRVAIVVLTITPRTRRCAPASSTADLSTTTEKVKLYKTLSGDIYYSNALCISLPSYVLNWRCLAPLIFFPSSLGFNEAVRRPRWLFTKNHLYSEWGRGVGGVGGGRKKSTCFLQLIKLQAAILARYFLRSGFRFTPVFWISYRWSQLNTSFDIQLM